MKQTSSPGYAPWTIVEGYDAPYRYATTGQYILDQVEKHLRGQPLPSATTVALPPAAARRPRYPTILETLDLSKQLDKKAYATHMAALPGTSCPLASRHPEAHLQYTGLRRMGCRGQGRRHPARHARARRTLLPDHPDRCAHRRGASPSLPVALLASSATRRPRDHYDRSWYGRVLVERVEQVAREDEWMRAYQEMNDFEEQLVAHGIVLLKFWLHISPEEQLQRFQAREATSYKQYKITADDYRNRAQWEAYEHAVHDMVERTSTAYAPWHLIAANDKYHARITMIQTFCKALAKRLKG